VISLVRNRRIVLVVVASASFAVIVGAFAFFSGPSTRGAYFVRAYDYRALYCGGAATLERANPYRVEPLRACEHDRPDATFKAEIPAWAVMPAPYPGYGLALYAQLSRFSYPLAKALWLATLSFAIAISVFALVEFTGWPLPIVALAFVPTGLLTNLFLGAAPPVALAGLTLAALLFSRGRAALAVVPLSFAMINPHLALPSAIALFIVAPQARLALCGAAAVLAAISLYAIGFTANVEYLRSVLPTHARAEVFHHYQYSLTHLLATLGVPTTVALDAGTISYAALAAFALYVVTRGAVRNPLERARVILVPAAFVTLGGSFIHGQEILIALPAALVLARCAKSNADRTLATIGLLGVLFSLVSDDLRIGTIAYVSACAALAFAIAPDRRVRSAFGTAFAAVLLVVAVQSSGRFGHESPKPSGLPAEPPGITASTDGGLVWAAFLASSPTWTDESPYTVALKIPTWLGLLSLVVLAFRVRPRVRDASDVDITARRVDFGAISDPIRT